MARITETVEPLTDTAGKNDLASPSDDTRRDGRLIATTEFSSSTLMLLKRSWHPTRLDIEDIKGTY